ncbi:MAG: PspC domain-containing protein [Anaerolineae bacterium]|nr:PspC domain-containing protein [Anaerolineae bacterium]
MSENKLERSEQDKVIAGVCGGIATYLDIEAIWVRLLFVLLALASGMGVVIYLVLWLIMPQMDGAGGGTAVLKENLDDMGHSVKRLGQPSAVGVVLILLGLLFLANQWGWFGGLFWPLLIIGVGVYLFSRRNGR